MEKNHYMRWAIHWPGNRLTSDGYLMGNCETGMTTLYRTRQEARDSHEMRSFNQMLASRPDLREPPHSWRAKRPVKVRVTVETIE